MIFQIILILLKSLLVLLGSFWLFFEYPLRNQKEILAGIPGPPIYPIVGNLLELGGKENIKYFTEQCQKYGSIFKLQLIRRMAVICCNPVDIDNILRRSNNNGKPKFVTNLLGSWVGEGLVTSSGPHWKAMRKAITPSFDYNMLKRFFVVFNQQTDILTTIMRVKTSEIENLDLFPLMQLFALDVICETAMGTTMKAQTNLAGNDYVKAVQEMEHILLKVSKNFLQQIPLIAPLTSLGRQQQQCLKIIKTTTDKVIRERKQQLTQNNSEAGINNEKGANGEASGGRVAFLDFLLTCRHSSGEPLTYQEIYDEVSTFMVAGHDSTATQMSFLLLLLSQNPEAQQKVYEEQIGIFGEDSKGRECSPTFEDIQRMNYLEFAIKESQRLYPTFPIYSREISEKFKLSNGIVLPKHVTFTVFLMQLHRDPEVYPNPEQFDPDRFLPENCRTRNPGAFVPFGIGPRNCIGQKYAMLEMKTCLSKLVRNFEFLPAYDENGQQFKPQLMMTILLASENGMQIRLRSRK